MTWGFLLFGPWCRELWEGAHRGALDLAAGGAQHRPAPDHVHCRRPDVEVTGDAAPDPGGEAGEFVGGDRAAHLVHDDELHLDVRDELLEIFAPEDLPTNSYYGNGAPIPDDVVAHLRQCYRDASTRFDWQRHDVLVVDNMLAAHAREPFTGPRKIAVAMADPSDG
ncbi:TauD/TfdA family dioxygenase [Streptomyces coeruleorubidus]|uniref:TauD/TfdA family dioxygenase n=1 Tax=Streptomyces coeruleorubidus TaxID=116188 RepID=UPI00370104A8